MQDLSIQIRVLFKNRTLFEQARKNPVETGLLSSDFPKAAVILGPELPVRLQVSDSVGWVGAIYWFAVIVHDFKLQEPHGLNQ